ncbi:hypothetical protein GY45DRAFT_1332654 [Cubamyces sp. BRFM 1775]|nr:hypothetical protein GY45DRAFT_1332654 [Cubamyces sp. BRFM 1775]
MRYLYRRRAFQEASRHRSRIARNSKLKPWRAARNVTHVAISSGCSRRGWISVSARRTRSHQRQGIRSVRRYVIVDMTVFWTSFTLQPSPSWDPLGARRNKMWAETRATLNGKIGCAVRMRWTAEDYAEHVGIRYGTVLTSTPAGMSFAVTDNSASDGTCRPQRRVRDGLAAGFLQAGALLARCWPMLLVTRRALSSAYRRPSSRLRFWRPAPSSLPPAVFVSSRRRSSGCFCRLTAVLTGSFRCGGRARSL